MFKSSKKVVRSNRFFLFLLPLAVILAGGVLFFSSKSYLVGSSCGCGMPSPEETGEFDYEVQKAIFNNQVVATDVGELLASLGLPVIGEPVVLGVTSEDRWIEIDLSDQRLYAHESDKIAYNFAVSTGKHWTPTPTGEFRIWIKLKYAKMSGGSGSSYYYLPNVPYIQYFHRDYGLHGAYWHNNFGQTMSHGCVNLSIPDSQNLFYWTSPPVPAGENRVYPSKDNPGTRVVVHD